MSKSLYHGYRYVDDRRICVKSINDCLMIVLNPYNVTYFIFSLSFK